MTIYVRKTLCYSCHKPILYDSDKNISACNVERMYDTNPTTEELKEYWYEIKE